MERGKEGRKEERKEEKEEGREGGREEGEILTCLTFCAADLMYQGV